MEYKFKLVLSEKERDLIIDLIEHRVFLIRARIEESPHPESHKEIIILEKLGDKLS
mgnify:FL=1|tara:strand:- start:3746 stop:3913 length:168 start_codon:yes stop_codon:yes gene_type:complete